PCGSSRSTPPAAALWAAVFVSAGYWLGHGIEALFGRIEPLERLLFPALAAALLLGLVLWLVGHAR
ncbi:hypothetical protein CNY89_15070, partial [Amaricoccus sp. HAR-UPW-R2A-40]